MKENEGISNLKTWSEFVINNRQVSWFFPYFAALLHEFNLLPLFSNPIYEKDRTIQTKRK